VPMHSILRDYFNTAGDARSLVARKTDALNHPIISFFSAQVDYSCSWFPTVEGKIPAESAS
jgi:hypothetical protein